MKMMNKNTLRGNRLNYNAGAQARYGIHLTKLITIMTREVEENIKALFDGKIADEFFTQQEEAAAMDASITSKAKILLNKLINRFTEMFSIASRKLSDDMVSDADSVSRTSLNASLRQLTNGLSLKTGIVPKGMEDVSKAIIQENVALIKSIPQDYLKNVSVAVMQSITTGNGLPDLIPKIQKYQGQTLRRARNIALDQTRKAYNSINKQRMQALGVKQFEWIHSGGGQHPRKSHIAMDGKIYSFDNLPVINKEQVDAGQEAPVKGIPGQAINCKCTMAPVIKFDDEE